MLGHHARSLASSMGQRMAQRSIPALSQRSQPFSSLSLAHLKRAPKAFYDPKRLGRGRSSGKGKTSTRGQKGYYARSGASGLIWYEGGQAQLWRRTPKFGFKNVNRHPLQPLNIQRLVSYIAKGRLDGTKPITIKEIMQSGTLRGRLENGVKLLGIGAEQVKRLPFPINVEVTHASRSARDAIVEAGGSVKFVWHSKLTMKHLLRPELFKPWVKPHEATPPPRLSLRYEHQLCGRDDLPRLQELRMARIQRRIRRK